jgi:hypothetical protein
VARPGSDPPPVNGEQVRDTRFWLPPHSEIAGYDARQVDGLVRRVAAELDAGRSAGPLIEKATFRRRLYRWRYDIDAVDWFLGQLLLPPGHVELAGISADPWRDLAVAQLVRGGVSGLAGFYPATTGTGQLAIAFPDRGGTAPGRASPNSARTRGATSATCRARTYGGGR